MTDDPTTTPKLPDWGGIAAAGGIDGWIVEELRRRDLWDDTTDTSKLSDKQRKRYKSQRQEERRVRKLLREHAWREFRRAHVVHVGTGIWYHDTADIDRHDVADPEARRRENELVDIPDAPALAKALELSVSRMRWLCFHRDVDTGTHYHRWTIPKRNGGTRLISAPKPDLKRVQRWIARNITEHLPVHGAAHGFVPGRSIATNAAPHAGATVVIKFDLRDFYPTVTMPRVKGMFRKAGYGEQVATLLALLCTESPREAMELRGKLRYVAIGPRGLPQGAPTSPSITNAISTRLDARLCGVARKLGFRYTRYADDLTFSWRGASCPVSKLQGSVRRIVEEEGFALHPDKTRIMRSAGRQRVTGLIVNRAPQGVPVVRADRRYRRRLRAAIHNRANGKPGPETLHQLRGMAAFIGMTDPTLGAALMDRIAALPAEPPDPPAVD